MPNSGKFNITALLITLGLVVLGAIIVQRISTQSVEIYDKDGTLLGSGEIKTNLKSKN